MNPHPDSFLRLCVRYLLILPLSIIAPNIMSYTLIVGRDEAGPNRLEIVIVICVLVALMMPILYRKSLVDGYNRRGAAYTLVFSALSFAFVGLTFLRKSYYELFPTPTYCETFPPEFNYCGADSQTLLSLLIINMGFLNIGLVVLSLGYLIQRPKGKRKNDTL